MNEAGANHVDARSRTRQLPKIQTVIGVVFCPK